MLLIFRLGRPDVLPVSDYGVRKGFALTFGKLKPTDKVTPDGPAHSRRDGEARKKMGSLAQHCQLVPVARLRPRLRRVDASSRRLRQLSRAIRPSHFEHLFGYHFGMATPGFDFTRAFLDASRERMFDTLWPRMRTCVESLTDEQVWWRPNQASNSVGNLLLHLNGNVRQWLVASFNRQEDKRERAAEFAEREGMAAAELLARLAATLSEGSAVLNRLTAEDLAAPMEIQGYQVTGLAAVYKVVEHFGLHYGQIVYITKMLRDQDLGFYKELNATGRPPRA